MGIEAMCEEHTGMTRMIASLGRIGEENEAAARRAK